MKKQNKKPLLICCPEAAIKIPSNFPPLSSASLRCSHSPSPSSRGPSGMATLRLICRPDAQVRCETGGQAEWWRRVHPRSIHACHKQRRRPVGFHAQPGHAEAQPGSRPGVLHVHRRVFPLVLTSWQLCYIWQQFEAFQLVSVNRVFSELFQLRLKLENVSSPSGPAAPASVRLTRSSPERLKADVDAPARLYQPRVSRLHSVYKWISRNHHSRRLQRTSAFSPP